MRLVIARTDKRKCDARNEVRSGGTDELVTADAGPIGLECEELGEVSIDLRVTQVRERIGIADIIVNPAWRPGSLTNSRLLSELRFWRNVDAVAAKLHFASLGGAMAADAKASGKAMQDALGKPNATARSVGAAGARALKPTTVSGVLVIGTAVRTVASRSAGDLEMEVKRRGLLGEIDERDKLNAGVQ